MSTPTTHDIGAPRVTYRELFADREYRSLFVADVVSQLGDQLAAVALAVLIYDRSHSPLLAAFAYCLAFLPWVVGGPILAAAADRLPCRRVLVGADLARAALVGVAAIPAVLLAVLGPLVLAAAMLAPPFRAARSGLVAQMLDQERYALSMSMQDLLNQVAQLVGFVAGGALVVLLTAHGALALNALSFAISGLMLLRRLAPRPAGVGSTERTSLWRETWAGFRLVAAEPRLRRPLLLAVVGTAYVIVPEAIAPAYAAQVGGGSVAVGLIMASIAVGSALGAVAVARLLRADARERVMLPLALAGTVPLLAVALRPGLVVSLVLFVAAGVCTAYNVPANAAFATAVPDGARARAFGVAMTAIMGGQILGIVLGGAIAEVLAPTTVVALAGMAGLAGVLLLQFDRDRGVEIRSAPAAAAAPPTAA